MRTNIIVKLQVEGMHNWPEASKHFNNVEYLQDRHRHIFHITLKKEVRHDNRDVEFILFKRQVIADLRRRFWNNKTEVLEFGDRSCESIAKFLMNIYTCNYVSVFEDNENGAEVTL